MAVTELSDEGWRREGIEYGSNLLESGVADASSDGAPVMFTSKEYTDDCDSEAKPLITSPACVGAAVFTFSELEDMARDVVTELMSLLTSNALVILDSPVIWKDNVEKELL